MILYAVTLAKVTMLQLADTLRYTIVGEEARQSSSSDNIRHSFPYRF